MRAIESVLLDFDGTLLDSNAAHAGAWKEYLAQKTGLDLPTGRVALMIGMGGDKIFQKLFGSKFSDREIKAMSNERDDLYMEQYFPRVKPIAGSVDFVRELAGRGFRLAVASSAKQKLLAPALKLVPIEPYLVGFSTPDEAEESKPAPDIFEAAMKKFDFDRNRTAVIGDSPYDVEAAKAASCRTVIGVLSGHFSYADLSLADEIYNDVDELRRKLDESALLR